MRYFKYFLKDKPLQNILIFLVKANILFSNLTTIADPKMANLIKDVKRELDDESQSISEKTSDKDSHNPHFQVDMNLIPVAHLKDEDDDLRGLGLDVFNQEELEQGQ